nr:uncharacterized protein LOC124493456 [Dermatophagoides farinae]
MMMFILYSMMIIFSIPNSNCDFWEFLDYIPTQPKRLDQMMITQNSEYPVPSYILPSKKIHFITEPGYYSLQMNEKMLNVIGTIKIYSHDPTKLAVFYIERMNVLCQTKNPHTFVRWFDGWNTEENVVIPYVIDHPDGYIKRFSDNFCEMGRVFRTSLKRYTATQNFAQVDYRFETLHHYIFSFFVYFKDNPQPCHALIMDTFDVKRKCPYFYSYTLQNYGNKPMNCSLFLMKQETQRYEGSFHIRFFQVGDPSISNVIQNGDKDPLTCASFADHLYINGNSGAGPHKTKELDFCNQHKPEVNKGGFPIVCPNVTIRLISSGQFQNKIVISYLPPTTDEICRWNEEKRSNTARTYHTLRC